MPQEILKAVIYCYRLVDKKDFTEEVVCLSGASADRLMKELADRQAAGKISDTHTCRSYVDATVRTPYVDGVDEFLYKLDTPIGPNDFTWTPAKDNRGIAQIWYGDGDICASVHGNSGLDIDADAIAAIITDKLNEETTDN